MPNSLPAIVKALRIQEKVKHVGFEWENKEQVWDKVEEEIGEFKAEIAANNQEKMEQEFGDVLFTEHLVNGTMAFPQQNFRIFNLLFS